MDHLKQLLLDQEERDQRNKSKAAKTRKFIITEGVFMNTGEICDLKMLVEFKYRFKVRIFLDESVSLPLIKIDRKSLLKKFYED